MHFFSFGFCLGCVISMVRNKITCAHFHLLSGNEIVRINESRSIFCGLLLGVVICCCRRHSRHYHRHIIDRLLLLVYRYTVLIELVRSTKERIKGIRQWDNNRLSLIVHTAALNLFHLSERVVWIIVAGTLFFPFSHSIVGNWAQHNSVQCTHWQWEWEWLWVHFHFTFIQTHSKKHRRTHQHRH